MAIKIFKFLCLEALQSPLFALDVLHVLHLSPIWRQNLRQTQNFENILMENTVYVEVNIDTRIVWLKYEPIRLTRKHVACP